jgi:Secretion system C-terminal sorting domain
MKKRQLLTFIFTINWIFLIGQNFSFDYNNNGARVCLVSSQVNLLVPSVALLLLDSIENANSTTDIYRRNVNGIGNDWILKATDLPAGTGHWIDTDVNLGEVWEYQVKRKNTWNYNSLDFDATGYTTASVLNDQSNYKGQMILLIANDVAENLSEKVKRLKRELTGEGWFVNEIIVNKANGWYSGDTVVSIKNQIVTIFNAAPISDKPKQLFILGHVPLPRSGATEVVAPDEHNENKGARGCDAYYADIDGMYTDTATYNPAGLASEYAINLPNDFLWDQDFFPSDIEMAFGRVDFYGLTDYDTDQILLVEKYLDRLSSYRNVEDGFYMGNKTAFFFGYDNSNDGSYRSLPSISKPDSVFQNYSSNPHPEWVQNNGPFMVYMQNLSVPESSQWNQYGMNATVFSSDQSYWGFGDVPQDFSIYSRIRSLLAADSKCLVTLWTTTGINIFHQPGMGESMGLSLKQIMNHNSSNNKLEKAPQEYDTEEWWNRTHFAYYGDPTLRLFQVYPPTGLNIVNEDEVIKLVWNHSPDSRLKGYHVYKSNSEFGVYNKISGSQPLLDTSFIDIEYSFGDWYMVRAVIHQETGSGKFINPSLGIFAQGNFSVSIAEDIEDNLFEIYPNPLIENNLTISTSLDEGAMATIIIVDVNGKVVYEKNTTIQGNLKVELDNTISDGIYNILINSNGSIKTLRFIKNYY